MPTTGWTENCPKCGVDKFEVEERYHERRGECSECAYFFERGFTRLEGFIRKPPDDQGKYMMVDTWFSLPSCPKESLAL
jgi:hypothetical protein